MSEDKHLSGEEKRRRMKEQFKKELQARKEFSDKVKNLRRQQRITEALEGMTMDDDSDQWIERLNQETAFAEAKTEMALEVAGSRVSIEEETTEEKLAMSDAEMQKIAAEEMVAKMKAEMAAEAEAGIATPESNQTANKDAESVSKDAEGGRLIEVEIGEDGAVSGAESAGEDAAAEKPYVRNMMSDFLDNEGESVEE